MSNMKIKMKVKDHDENFVQNHPALAYEVEMAKAVGDLAAKTKERADVFLKIQSLMENREIMFSP